MGKHNKYALRSDGRRETKRYYEGLDKPKHFYGRTDEEIEAQIAAFEKELKHKKDNPTRTFEETADIWWERKEKEISPSTAKAYACYVKMLEEEFGSLKVDTITPLIVIQYLRRLAAEDFSSKVINNRKSIIKGILDESVILGDIQQNPCLNLPEVKGKAAQKRTAASEEDVAIIEKTKLESMYSRLSYFMLFTGCRRSEAVGLMQKDIDRITKTAKIERAVVYRTETPQIKSTKTTAGTRRIVLPDNVLEILPISPDPESYVFFPKGLPRSRELQRGLKNYQETNGIQATAHQLRHSYASMLHSASVDPKDAQGLLGHSSIVVTEDIYTQLEEKHRLKVGKQINNYVQSSMLGKALKKCKSCGNDILSAPDGTPFKFCPNCGKKIVSESRKSSEKSSD